MNSLPHPSRQASLNSWKEISTYLGRGVRTVQRWEEEFHLPVHRVGTGRRAPVFALEHELRAWLQAIRIGTSSKHHGNGSDWAVAHAQITHHAAELTRQLITSASEHRRLIQALQDNLEQMVRARELVRQARLARTVPPPESADWTIARKAFLAATSNAR